MFRCLILIVIFLIGGTGIVYAAEAAQPPQEEEQNLGNPLGDQPMGSQGSTQNAPKEEEKAVKLSLLYSAELWDNVSGGIKQGQSTINNFDASIAIDGGKTFGWDGSSFLLDTFYARSADLRNLTGATQQTSAYETDTGNIFRVYQALYDQKLNDDQTSVLIGLYDLNTEFDTIESSQLFFNSGFGFDTTFDQSGLNGPSTYPDTSLSLRVRQKIDEVFSLQAAVLDGVPDDPSHPTSTSIEFSSNKGALLVGELDYIPTDDTKALLGYWYYTARFDELGAAYPQQQTGNQGAYVGIGQTLYEPKEGQKLDGFLRIGVANSTVNEFGKSLDGGLVYTGLIEGREKDQLGLAMNIAENGQPFKDQEDYSDVYPRDYESDIELTYRAPINDWLAMQPDAQYTINPGSNPLLKNDLIIGLRLEFGYNVGFDSLQNQTLSMSQHP